MAEKKSEEMTERAQLVRLYEASCSQQYQTAHQLNFQLALMKKIGLAFNLREVKSLVIDGPAKPAPARPLPMPPVAGKK